MVETTVIPVAITGTGLPTLLSTARAVLPCGCGIYLGVFVHNQEKGTGVVPCSMEHDHLASHVTMLIKSSLVEPTDRRMVDVAEELLEQAARAHGVPS